jgi:hypothetical protein
MKNLIFYLKAVQTLFAGRYKAELGARAENF